MRAIVDRMLGGVELREAPRRAGADRDRARHLAPRPRLDRRGALPHVGGAARRHARRRLDRRPAAEPPARAAVGADDRAHGADPVRRADARSLSIVVPFRSIESEVGRLPTGAGDLSGTQETDAAAAAALAVSLSETFVELRVEVASKELSLADVLALKPGDVVGLDAQAETGVTIFAEVVPVHRARPGRRGARRAVEVLERLEAHP